MLLPRPTLSGAKKRSPPVGAEQPQAPTPTTSADLAPTPMPGLSSPPPDRSPADVKGSQCPEGRTEGGRQGSKEASKGGPWGGASGGGAGKRRSSAATGLSRRAFVQHGEHFRFRPACVALSTR
ncbi:TMF-regulated nuclear protein 1-like [Penaeus japonicus]|uniref:TMF-regulated nuclear protein 1-like n=1 Tax=Penaeus japonicus TaxID=27405 RepID=UPI001C710D27|nr:TMF-regulated nuclear protein 1-like [Penaeus japonicus]